MSRYVKGPAQDPVWIALEATVNAQSTVAGKLAAIYVATDTAPPNLQYVATEIVLTDALDLDPDGQDPAAVLMMALQGRRDATWSNALDLSTIAGDTIQGQCPLPDGSPGTLTLDDALSRLAAVDPEAANIIANLALGAAAAHDTAYYDLMCNGLKTRTWFVINAVLHAAGQAAADALQPIAASPVLWVVAGVAGLWLLSRFGKRG